MANAYLEVTGRALIDPVVLLWNTFVSALPGLVGAIVVLIIGYILGFFLGFIVKEVVERSKIDEHLQKAKLSDSIGFIRLSTLAGGLVKWYVFVLFLATAVELTSLGVISELLRDFARWLPNLFIGILVFLFGLIAADFAADRVMHAKMKGIKLFSAVVRVTIIIFMTLMALEQIEVKISLASAAFLVVLAGIILGVALALGIGFGLALKDEAKGIVKKLKKDL